MSGNTRSDCRVFARGFYEAKRAKLDLDPKVQVSDPGAGNSFDVKWDGSELIKVQEGILYRTPTAEFKGLLWYLELHSCLVDKVQEYWHNINKYVLTECLLKVANKHMDKDIEFDGCIMITSSYSQHDKNFFNHKDTKKSRFTTFPRLTVDRGTDGHVVVVWREEEILIDEGFLDYISLKLIYLGDNITDQEVKYFKMQMPLLAQMKKDAKGVEMILKFLQINNGGEGLPPEDFFIESKDGSIIGFHKAVLQVRGGEFFKCCLKPGTMESLTSQLKWDAYDEEVVRGFKEYLYTGTISNLAHYAFDYFKLGDYCLFKQIREVAEMELCKSIVEGCGGVGLEQALEITKSYNAEYLKEEILKIWEENGQCEGLVREYFYNIVRA